MSMALVNLAQVSSGALAPPIHLVWSLASVPLAWSLATAELTQSVSGEPLASSAPH